MRDLPRVLVTSTLRSHGWGGSENYWHDFVQAPAAREAARFHLLLRRSPEAEAKVAPLLSLGHEVTWDEPVIVRPARRLARAVKGRLSLPLSDIGAEQWEGWLASIQPDLIVFAMSSTIDYYAVDGPAAMARERGIPYWVIVQHSFENFFAPNDAEGERLRAVFEHATRAVFIAPRNLRTVERAVGAPLPRAFSSQNGLSEAYLERAGDLSDARRQVAPAALDAPVVLLNLARFEPEIKGQHLLLEALSGDAWRDRNWKLLLVGGGRNVATLGRMLRFYDLEERVEVLGYVDDVLEVIRRADLAVMPSLSEGTPYAMLEMMAAGLPAVATPVGGLPSIVIDDQTGWLARAPTCEALADALERAWEGRASWHDRGRAAAALVSRNHRSDRLFAELGVALADDLGSC